MGFDSQTIVRLLVENGRYRITGKDGAAVGWNRVEVRAMHKTSRMISKGLGGTGKMTEEQTEFVATRFNSESTLKVAVAPGENTANSSRGVRNDGPPTPTLLSRGDRPHGPSNNTTPFTSTPFECIEKRKTPCSDP
jgi:hypothetical protein